MIVGAGCSSETQAGGNDANFSSEVPRRMPSAERNLGLETSELESAFTDIAEDVARGLQYVKWQGPAVELPCGFSLNGNDSGDGGGGGGDGGGGGPTILKSLLVIPGDVAFLNQFFSLTVLAQNGAPAGSNPPAGLRYLDPRRVRFQRDGASLRRDRTVDRADVLDRRRTAEPAGSA